MLNIGDYKIVVIQESFYNTDGGASHGPVPKALWQKNFKVFPDNTIEIATNLLLIIGKINILVDAGVGDYLSEKQRKYLNFRKDKPLSEFISPYIDLKKIDYVVFSHLHYDHVGAIVENKEIIFKNAKFVIQKREFQDAHSNHIRLKTAYPNRVFDSIPEDKLLLVDGNYSLNSDITLINTAGHTPGHQSLILKSKSNMLIYTGDIMPLKSHVNPLWVSGYDLDPLKTIDSKLQILDLAYKNKAIVVYTHDIDKYTFITKDEKGRYIPVK